MVEVLRLRACCYVSHNHLSSLIRSFLLLVLHLTYGKVVTRFTVGSGAPAELVPSEYARLQLA